MSATLASLRIRNLALVEDLLWEPGPGCVAVTGETGAGKSIILGAIKLLLGERADKSLVRTGADTCTVEGAFSLPDDSVVHRVLDQGGIEPCENGLFIIRRTITTAGSGKQFANGSPCTLATLREVGDLLVDLHGPHDHQSLFSRDQQIFLLDSFAAAGELRSAYVAARKDWMRLVAEKNRLSEDSSALAREADLLDHQVREIEEAGLQTGEEEPLVARQMAASHGQRLAELSAKILALTGDSDDSIHSRLTELARLTREMHRLDPAASALSDSATGIFESVQDFSRTVERYSESLESDPAQLAQIESRLDLLQSLKRKYGTSVEAVIEFGATAGTRLAELRTQEERGAGLDGEIASAADALAQAAKKLTRARTSSAPKLAALVKRHLADLGFARAGFSLALESLAEPGPHGAEQVEFLFAPNPGEPERPLRAIASSGEISRVMLALKTSLAAQDSIPILIFDEIDANVGGEIGAKIGAKMRDLGSSHQVFCITHLPQVASTAATQFVVKKDTSGNRTSTSLEAVVGEDREREIARMLGGTASSALAHARALLAAT